MAWWPAVADGPVLVGFRDGLRLQRLQLADCFGICGRGFYHTAAAKFSCGGRLERWRAVLLASSTNLVPPLRQVTYLYKVSVVYMLHGVSQFTLKTCYTVAILCMICPKI